MTSDTKCGAAVPGYALGADSAEAARLRRQSQELLPETQALLRLLGELGLRPGQSSLDLGCGPSGILAQLADAVTPSGRVTGLDADPAHVAAATRHARRLGLGNVEVLAGDARATGLPDGSFDLVHARLLLVTVPEPPGIVAEMARLTRPGGLVASQEADVGCAVCYPELPEWERLRALLRASFNSSGADPCIGRRLTELLRGAGLTGVGVAVHAGCYPVGHSRRTLLPDLVRSLRHRIIAAGLASESELTDVEAAVRAHLADPRTLVMPHLLMTAWGRKPAR
jgi:SAM-dependent methyltransferase